MKTVALFGGSFDPPHIGHEAIIKALLEMKELDEIIIMPTYLNPFKERSFAPAPLRLKWLEEAFAHLQKVSVSSYEVEQNRKVPTIETLHHLQKSFAKIYIVIGADNVAGLQNWQEFERLNSNASFLVASREEIEIPSHFSRLQVDEKISSSELREDIRQEYLPSKIAKQIIKHYKENNER